MNSTNKINLPTLRSTFATKKELIDFKRSFNCYLTANELDEKSEAVRVAHLRCTLNDKLNDLIDKITGTITVEQIFKYLEEELIPKENTCFNQYCFFNRSQREKEAFNEYYLELDQLARLSNLGEKHDEILKARIVCGIYDPAMRERLMRAPDMTLKEVVNYCRMSEDAGKK
ncbi:uncharacterized protein LOC113473526 [Diaphorina citri]|uniref:Uncharacterized protein LOC113473526 n=1 Tax=Diaphorina citri TaxID=121845 RepID=A0A3Q0JKJ0_DIACI|nr:uncharacterized protein LOC113473526 [Diaphorina citri]